MEKHGPFVEEVQNTYIWHKERAEACTPTPSFAMMNRFIVVEDVLHHALVLELPPGAPDHL